jgi:hypothetical protein
MQFIETEIKDDIGYILPMGDLHLGDKSFSEESMKQLTGYIAWVKEHKNSRVFLMGDIFNCATRNSKTSPFEQKNEGIGEFELAIKLFSPIKDQIIGAIDGNHEHRLEDFANHNITLAFCHALGIQYASISAVVNVKIGKRNRTSNGGNWKQQYQLYMHHTTGGGSSMGGKINRAEKLMDIVEGCDAYIGGHNHGIVSGFRRIFYPNMQTKKVEDRKVALVCIGGYVDYNGSYAERLMLPPTKLGSVRIRLDGNKHDIHVSQ